MADILNKPETPNPNDKLVSSSLNKEDMEYFNYKHFRVINLEPYKAFVHHSHHTITILIIALLMIIPIYFFSNVYIGYYTSLMNTGIVTGPLPMVLIFPNKGNKLYGNFLPHCLFVIFGMFCVAMTTFYKQHPWAGLTHEELLLVDGLESLAVLIILSTSMIWSAKTALSQLKKWAISHGQKEPPNGLAIWIFLTSLNSNLILVTYASYLAVFLFAPSTTEIQRVLVRLVFHPLLFEFCYLPHRILGNKLKRIWGAKHVAVGYLVPISTMASLWGRVMLFSLTSEKLKFIVSAILSIEDVMFRVSHHSRDKYFYYLPRYGFEKAIRLIGFDISTHSKPTMYDEMLLFDELGESISICVAGYLTYFLRLVPSFDSENFAGPSLNNIIYLVIFQLILEYLTQSAYLWVSLGHLKNILVKKIEQDEKNLEAEETEENLSMLDPNNKDDEKIIENSMNSLKMNRKWKFIRRLYLGQIRMFFSWENQYRHKYFFLILLLNVFWVSVNFIFTFFHDLCRYESPVNGLTLTSSCEL